MDDLTICYLTLNLLPKGWYEYQQKVLLDAVGDTKIISVSRLPIDLGINIIQSETPSASNIYWQILKVCRMVTTEFIAIAEDDTLYVPDHFGYRPPKNVAAYNVSHWSLFTWGEPIYSWRNRHGNYSMIASREFVIEALEERYLKYPNGTPDGKTGEIGRWRTDKMLGVTPRKVIDFYTPNPIINFNHEMGMDDRAKRHQKSLGSLRAYDIPYWGRADKLILKFQ